MNEVVAKIEYKRNRALLTIQLMRGSVGFDDCDTQMSDALVALLREHLAAGARLLLIDLSGASFVYGFSFALVVEPWCQAELRHNARIAVVFGANE